MTSNTTQVGDDPVDDLQSVAREAASLEELAAAVAGEVLRDDEDPIGPVDESWHRSGLHQPARDPVGRVLRGGRLRRAEYGGVDAATDHRSRRR